MSPAIVSIILVLIQNFPAAIEAIQRFKKKNDRLPTAAEARALMDGIYPPESYPRAIGVKRGPKKVKR